MATLTTAARKRLPPSAFGLEKQRAYPVEDKAHARNALARASQQRKRGNLSQSQYDEIVAKANRVLGKKGSQ